MIELGQREAEAAKLEAEMAEVCGVVNAATGRLVGLIARVIETGSWEGWGIRSARQWVGWKCGVSPSRATELVAMATRLGELPATRAALEAGEVSADQAAVVCRHVPAVHDAEAAELARVATVPQLRHALSRYSFGQDAAAGAEVEATGQADDEARQVCFGSTSAGRWGLTADLPIDEGALVERALSEARQSLFLARHGDEAGGAVATDVSWSDALVAMAEASLAAGASARPYRDRHTVLIHIDADERRGHVHGGPCLPDALRRLVSCDAKGRLVLCWGGRPVSVGRAARIVPDHTRTAVEDRDRSCRVPGCERGRWLQVHHILHWEDGGASDTANLVALCSAHHSPAPPGAPGHRGRRRRSRRAGVQRPPGPPPGGQWPAGPTR